MAWFKGEEEPWIECVWRKGRDGRVKMEEKDKRR